MSISYLFLKPPWQSKETVVVGLSPDVPLRTLKRKISRTGVRGYTAA